jgi:hypothetical protein
LKYWEPGEAMIDRRMKSEYKEVKETRKEQMVPFRVPKKGKEKDGTTD